MTCRGNNGYGQANPANECEWCVAGEVEWSDNDGVGCDDGLYCTVDDVCSGGTCSGAARDCADGVACDGDESCDEDGDACAPGVNQCPAGQVCDVFSDECLVLCPDCSIGGPCTTDSDCVTGTACPAGVCI